MSASPKPRSKRNARPVAPPEAAWWRQLFVESEDAQLVCDGEGVICEINRKAAQQFGLARRGALFQSNLLAPGAAGQLRDALARSVTHTETLGTIGVTCPNGACLVADLHLEKGAAFAALGMLLPPYDTRTTLERLAKAIAAVEPSRVVALGDSFHRAESAERLAADERAFLL